MGSFWKNKIPNSEIIAIEIGQDTKNSDNCT